MANDIQIQEPNDLGSIHITDEMAENIAVLVYSKDASTGGIKRLGLLNWKEYLDYDYKRVQNLRDNIDRTIDLEVPFPPSDYNIRAQIDNIAHLTGVDVNPPAIPPDKSINERLGSVETTLGDSSGGLVKTVNDNSNNIQTLSALVGEGGGGSPDSIITRLNQVEITNSTQDDRITALEGTVGDDTDGLVKDVANLSNTVGDDTDGLVKDVANLSNTVGDDTDGLVKSVNDLETNVNSLSGTVGDDTTGLVKSVNDLETNVTDLSTTVGNSTTGLVKSVNDLRYIVGTDTNQGLQKDVSDLQEIFKVWNSGEGVSLSEWLNDPSDLLFLISAYKSSGDKTYLGLYIVQNGTLNDIVGDYEDFFTGPSYTIRTPAPTKLTATRLA